MAKEIGSWGRPRPRDEKPARRTDAARSSSRPTPKSGPRPGPGSSPGSGDPADLILPHLKPGETLVWSSYGSGIALNWRLLARSLRILIFLPVLAFVVVGFADFIPPPALIPVIVLIGLPLLAARALFSPMFKAYGVTTQRVIIVDRLLSFNKRSLWPTDFGWLKVTGGARGSILFYAPRIAMKPYQLPQKDPTAIAALHGIDAPVAVARFIQEKLGVVTQIETG